MNVLENFSGCLKSSNNVVIPRNSAWDRDTDWDIRVIFGNNRSLTDDEALEMNPGIIIDIRSDDVETDEPDEVEWSSVPVIGNARELAVYMRNMSETLANYIPVRFINGYNPELLDTMIGTGIASIDSFNVSNDNRENRIVYRAAYYPGARIVYAVENDEMGILDSDNLAILEAARPIVKKAMEQPTLLQRELYIHDTVAGMVTYKHVDFSKEEPFTVSPGRSAKSAILDGAGNCQGFSDAFYLLGNLAGLDVGYWTGESREPHAWNTVTIDGLTYFVDVTIDRNGFTWNNTNFVSHVFFNATREIISADHTWKRDYEAGLNIAEKVDGNFFFTTPEYDETDGKLFGTYYSSIDERFTAIAEQLIDGDWSLTNFMPPYDKRYENVNNAVAKINESLNRVVQQNNYENVKYNYQVGIKYNKNWKSLFITVYNNLQYFPVRSCRQTRKSRSYAMIVIFFVKIIIITRQPAFQTDKIQNSTVIYQEQKHEITKRNIHCRAHRSRLR